MNACSCRRTVRNANTPFLEKPKWIAEDTTPETNISETIHCAATGIVAAMCIKSQWKNCSAVTFEKYTLQPMTDFHDNGSRIKECNEIIKRTNRNSPTYDQCKIAVKKLKNMMWWNVWDHYHIGDYIILASSNFANMIKVNAADFRPVDITVADIAAVVAPSLDKFVAQAGPQIATYIGEYCKTHQLQPVHKIEQPKKDKRKPPVVPRE